MSGVLSLSVSADFSLFYFLSVGVSCFSSVTRLRLDASSCFYSSSGFIAAAIAGSSFSP